MRVAVIMAGGSGQRFWPLSRKSRPKQLLALTNDKPMVANTVDRAARCVGVEQVYIVAGPELTPQLETALPELPKENFIVEPMRRNTGPCLALAAAVLQARHGAETTMGVMTADHLIPDLDAFARNADLAYDQAAKNRSLVTMGVRPTFPSTGLGYLELGEKTADDERGEVYKVERFKEKPDLPTAKQFLEAGNYLWNSGMFFWRVDVLIDAFHKYAPAIGRAADQIMEAEGGDDFNTRLTAIFNELDSKSIDYAVMEHAENVEAVAAAFAWHDVGTWSALDTVREKDERNNIRVGRTVAMDTENCIIHNLDDDNETLVATMGVKDLVIVSSGDAVLVCPRDKEQDIKQLLAQIKDEGYEGKL
ncbi:MAG: mannose-1-phosphate guanylyltransferase [Candidatus Sumerlaeota bacterium]